MEIVIIRHGKSIVDTSGWVNALEFGECVKEYDNLGIDEEHLPSEEAIKKAESCNFTVCSTLARSLHSAKLLNIESPDLIGSLYRECELPYTNWKRIKLSKTTWPIVYRILQILGYSPNAESYKEAKIRSEEVAIELEKLAMNHGSVLFVGHGALSWLLHGHLLSMGWSGPNKSVRDHWDFRVYRYKET